MTKPPRRVLFLEPAGQLWGSERSLVLLLRELAALEWFPAVCLPRHAALSEEIRVLGLPSYPWFVADLHRKGSLARGRALAGLLAAGFAFRPDIIHVNQAGAVHAAAIAARLLSRPLVVHVRLAEDAALVARRAQALPRVAFIANSAFVADRLRSEGLPADRIWRITNPVEPPALTPPPMEKRRWHMGFVGRLSRDKGIEVFLRAASEAVRRRPETKVVVVGSSGGRTTDGQDYLEAMKALARSLNFPDPVEFLGFRRDAVQLMQQMRVLVMPSEAEPWGRVLVEGMMTGAAVVACDSGGPREIIHNNVTGLLIPVGDAKAIADAVTRLLSSPETTAQMTTAGRRWAQEACAPQRHAKQVACVYEAMLKPGELGPTPR